MNNPYNKLASKFRAIEDLIKMKLLRLSPDKKVYLYSKPLWLEKDKKFKTSWCINIYIYYSIWNAKTMKEKTPLSFIDLETETEVAVCDGDSVTFFD
jgi:hypothetical protein